MIKKPKVKLIVSDIEGCIMSASRKKAKLKYLAKIENYCDKAKNNSDLPPLVFCTGRQSSYVECLTQITGAFFSDFPSIVENGAILYFVSQNKFILNPILTKDVLKKVKIVKEEVETWIMKNGGTLEQGKEICISVNPPLEETISNFYVNPSLD